MSMHNGISSVVEPRDQRSTSCGTLPSHVTLFLISLALNIMDKKILNIVLITCILSISIGHIVCSVRPNFIVMLMDDVSKFNLLVLVQLYLTLFNLILSQH